MARTKIISKFCAAVSITYVGIFYLLKKMFCESGKKKITEEVIWVFMYEKPRNRLDSRKKKKLKQGKSAQQGRLPYLRQI